jgi:hypothetical protein
MDNVGIDVKDLTLTVERQVPGELVTNALAIETFVADRIKDFTPERYYDDPEEAKKDRAVLNSAAKALNDRRLALEREFLAPFDPVKSAIKRATDMLASGASKLDEIVKAVEETIKNEKRRDIEDLFASKSFSLVALDRIFDQKWLNKTTPMKDVDSQLSAKIEKIYSDIQVIESLPADADEAKAQYLDTLDIGSALATSKRLKENRERLAKEAEERAEREHQEHINVQAKELAKDTAIEMKAAPLASMASAALEVEEDPVIEYTLRFRGTRAQLIQLREYMTRQGIEYDKL